MTTKLLLGAGVLAAAVALWVRLAGTRPQDVIDDYPVTGDWYPWDLMRDAMKT